ncbi:hypothetical protein U9M48_013418 [Paspalum notatum var. saurae]|uniref:Integrase catalytic domain-containing protein n=1 Tax=Paspalum notatum var. saurae TaxID=547442 RepID=A0AAQ3SZB6_PASNO
MFQPLEVPAWKWEDVHMDFIVGLPRTQKGYDSIWIIVDRQTKSAYFLPVKTCYTTSTYAGLYVSQIVSLHDVTRTITSDRGSLFVSRFWEQLQAALGIDLNRSLAYHPQTSGQWDECLPLAEFAYNNSYQKSLEMAPFETLYGRWCRTPLTGPNQKSYSDKRKRPLVFEEGDHVYLRVSPMKGVHQFGVKEKLAPRYVGPFKITERFGPVAYRLELPPHLAAVHDVFHVSQLKKRALTKCNGVITPKKRQLGNKKHTCKLNILVGPGSQRRAMAEPVATTRKPTYGQATSPTDRSPNRGVKMRTLPSAEPYHPPRQLPRPRLAFAFPCLRPPLLTELELELAPPLSVHAEPPDHHHRTCHSTAHPRA